MPNQYGDQLYSDLDSIVEQLLQKQADNADGSSDAKSTHPSASISDETQKATTGSRASENESDVKKNIPVNVNSASESEAEGGEGRGEKSPHLHTGQTAKATGEDPANETSSAKGDIADPGTSHPAKATFGEKYSSLYERGNDILAKIALLKVASTDKTAADKEVAVKMPQKPDDTIPADAQKELAKKKEGEGAASGKEVAKDTAKEAAKKCKCGKTPCECSKEAPKVEAPAAPAAPVVEEKKASTEEISQAFVQGYGSAAVMADKLGLTKESAAPVAPKVTADEVIIDIVKAAHSDVANVFDYLTGFIEGLNEKKAADEEGGEKSEKKDSSDSKEPAESKSEPEDSAPAAPADGGAGAPPAAGGGDQQKDEMMQLVEALLAAGVTPEDLLALAGQGGGAAGGAGAPPPMGGGAGAPPPMPPMGGAGAGAPPMPPAGGGGLPPGMEVGASLNKKAALKQALQQAIAKVSAKK